MRTNLADVGAVGLGPEVSAKVEEVLPMAEAYLVSADEIITTAGSDLAAGRAAQPKFQESFEALKASLPGVGDLVAELAATAEDEGVAQRNAAIRLLLLVSAAGILILTLLGWLITRSVVRPLRASASWWPPSPAVTSPDPAGSPAPTRSAGSPARSTPRCSPSAR